MIQDHFRTNTLKRLEKNGSLGSYLDTFTPLANCTSFNATAGDFYNYHMSKRKTKQKPLFSRSVVGIRQAADLVSLIHSPRRDLYTRINRQIITYRIIFYTLWIIMHKHIIDEYHDCLLSRELGFADDRLS